MEAGEQAEAGSAGEGMANVEAFVRSQGGLDCFPQGRLIG